MPDIQGRLAAFLTRLNTHSVALSGLSSIVVAILAIVMVGMQHAIDDALTSSGFWPEALRGVYDAFVKYFALPVVVTLVAAGGLAAYLGRPRNVPGAPPPQT